MRLLKAREGEISREYVGKFLLNYSKLSSAMSQYEKKHLLSLFIDSIELYPEKTNGHWMKTVHFKFPIIYNNKEGSEDLEVDSLPSYSTVECIALLQKQN